MSTILLTGRWPTAKKKIFQPLGRLLHLDAADGHAGIPGTTLTVLNTYFDRAFRTVHGERLHRRHAYPGILLSAAGGAMSHHRRALDIAGHTEMTGRIHTVRREFHLNM